MRIKICGITRPEDARAASRTGADLLGFNFYPASPRYIGDRAVDELLAAAESPAVPVAVTVNAKRKELDALLAPSERIGPRGFAVVQLHGHETPATADYLIARRVKVIKAFQVSAPDFAAEVRAWVERVRTPGGLLAVLLDAPPREKRQYGGSGRLFDWTWIAEAREAGELAGLPPILLAGGLNVTNVAKAVQIARPWGVDAASGVEVEDSPGVKSLDKIRNFIRNARVG